MTARTLSPQQVYQQSLQTAVTLQRAYADLQSDYRASKEQRFLKRPTGINTQGSGADYHWKNEADYYLCIELARHIAREDQVVGQGIRTLRRNVVQGGFRVKPETGDSQLDRQLSDRWANWAGSPLAVDVEGEHCWHDLERLYVEALIRDGDIGVNPLTTGQLQSFEAHRIRSPQIARTSNSDIVLGVHRDANGKRLRYYVTKQDYDGINRRSLALKDVSPISAYVYDEMTQQQERNFFHLYAPRRISETRGATPLLPVMITSQMHDDVQFSKLVQSQVCSYFAIIHNVDPDSVTEAPETDTVEDECDPTKTREQRPLHPGAEYWGQPGEKIEGFSPNVPNPSFFEHSHMLLSFIAVNLDLPLILLMMDASQTNFSGWRGAFDQAKIRFRDIQTEIADRLHRNVYRWKVRQWMRQDADLRRMFEVIGPAMFAHSWHYPTWPYIQPLDDINASALEVHTIQTSPRRAALKRGQDWPVLVREYAEDRKLAIREASLAARELNEEFPEAKVDWREICNFELPQGYQLSLPVQDQEQKSNEPSANRTT